MYAYTLHIWDNESLGITDLSVWVGYWYSGSQTKIVLSAKISILNCGFETIILRFIFNLSDNVLYNLRTWEVLTFVSN